ncbi:MAG: serine hydrolase [Armatimonadetes bacterium]|nr:serine hydrolase [Armatimonadota bacterium]
MIITKFYFFIVIWTIITLAACDRSEDLYWPEKEWKTASPELHQMDSAVLMRAVNAIKDGNYGNIRSLLIVKNGYIITEEYFHTADTFILEGVNSVTKSVLSAVWGIAENNGDVPPIDTPLEKALPEYAPLIQADSLKQRITIRDLLTMTAGMDWVENDLREGQVTNDFFELINSEDDVAYALNKPMVDTPSTVFNYNSGCSMILSAILTANSGRKFGEYANEHLLSQIGIDSAYCVETLKLSNAASGLFLTSREMARFGLLITREGEWDGKQIIPRDWVQQSTAPIVPLYNYPLVTGYGYQWWHTTEWLSVGIRDTITAHMAIGWGGQMIAAVPKHDLVIVITASQTANEQKEMDPIFIIWQHIFPAIRPVATAR